MWTKSDTFAPKPVTMKSLKLITSCLLCFLFFGCYEVNEAITINENGSGRFITKMDMGQMIEMMQSFGGDEMNQEGLDKPVDTVINMSSFVDSAKEWSDEQKELMRNGKMHLVMNIKEKIFKLDTDFPFNNYSQLQSLLSSNGGGMQALTGAMKKVFDKGKGIENNNQPDTPKDPDLDQLGNIFDVIATNGTISKVVNKARYQTLMAKPEMEQMKQVSASGIEILYTTTLQLPRPVISSDNPLLKLSEDKKTITIKYNYLELFETPEKFSYTIKY